MGRRKILCLYRDPPTDVQGGAAGFDTGKGEKLSKSQALYAMQAAWLLLSFSPIRGQVLRPHSVRRPRVWAIRRCFGFSKLLVKNSKGHFMLNQDAPDRTVKVPFSSTLRGGIKLNRGPAVLRTAALVCDR